MALSGPANLMTMAVLAHFECPICFELMQDAMVTGCGHSFCQACAVTNCTVGRRCPTCRAAVPSLVANYFIRELIADVSEAVATARPVGAQDVSLSGLELLDSMGFAPDIGPAALREANYDTEKAVEIALVMAEYRAGHPRPRPRERPTTPSPEPVLLETDGGPALFKHRFQRALQRVRAGTMAEGPAGGGRGASSSGSGDPLRHHLAHLDPGTLRAFTELMDSGILDASPMLRTPPPRGAVTDPPVEAADEDDRSGTASPCSGATTDSSVSTDAGPDDLLQRTAAMLTRLRANGVAR
eukprot:EG_transcript_21663